MKTFPFTPCKGKFVFLPPEQQLLFTNLADGAFLFQDVFENVRNGYFGMENGICSK